MHSGQSDPTNEILEKVRAEIKKWQLVEAALLQGQQIVGESPRIATATVRPDGRQRAPRGAFESALLETLKSGSKTNAQIQEALKAANYTWPYTSERIRLTLKENLKGKVKSKGEGKDTVYSLK